MPPPVEVHLLPKLVTSERLGGGLVVVIDVLRATTTAVYALAAGADAILPVASIEAAHETASRLGRERCVLAGERRGLPIDGFDLGNSPAEYSPDACSGRTIVFTTTNGTRAILHAHQAARVLLGAFVNFSAVCEELLQWQGPIHLLCAGTDGAVTLEDTLLAGAIVDYLETQGRVNAKHLDDAARLAWDSYGQHGELLIAAFPLSRGGRNLLAIGQDGDLKDAAAVDRFRLVPEVVDATPTVRPSKAHLDAEHFRGDSGLFE